MTISRWRNLRDDVPSVERGAAELDRLINAKRSAVPTDRPGDENAVAGAADALRVAYRCVSDVEAKPIRWLWQGRIARGKVSILAGNPGLGKSQITASMAAIVSIGGSWPVDRTSCEQGKVIILSAEDDVADTIRPRLEAAGADLKQVFCPDAVVESYTADGSQVRGAPSTSKAIWRNLRRCWLKSATWH